MFALIKTIIMKTLSKLLVVCFVFGLISCKDTKKEEEQTKAARWVGYIFPTP